MGKEKLQRKMNRHELEKIAQAENSLRAKVTYFLEKIKDNASRIDSLFVRFNSKKEIRRNVFHHFTEIWMRWLDYDISKYENDAFAGIEPTKFNNPEEIWRAPTAEIFWKSINFYENCSDMKWQLRFTKKAKNKVIMWDCNTRQNLLELLVEFSLGHIAPHKNCMVIEEGPCANMIFFTAAVKGTEAVLIFAVLLDRLPIIKNKKLVQYKFNHYLKVIDVLKKNKDIKNSIEAYKKSIKNDPDRWIEPLMDNTGQFIFPSFQNSVNQQGILALPKPMSRIYLSSRESESIIYDSDNSRWISQKLLEAQETVAEIDPYKLSIVDKLGTATSCAEFIRFLKRIPDFRIKLTEEQESLVGCPGNVLAIGRSGTGKTTCSLLRLLSTEMLFRYTTRDRTKRFSPEDLDRSVLLHTVFVTASPVLTNEVKTFYEKLNSHIKEKLKEKEKKLQPKDLEEEDLETLALEMEDDPVFEESESEEEVQGPSSMEFLRDEDFPLFVTVRKVIFMVDAAMKRPFFARDRNGDVIGSNTKFQWHNELKGALMINKQFKLQRQTEDIGKIEVSSSDSDEELDLELPCPKSSPPKLLAANRHYRKMFRHLSYEVDFRIFCEKFFPRIGHKCTYSPLLLWTEISAYIKGSAQSFKFSGYYLPRASYINMGRKTSMLTPEEKYEIWDLFILYERWKVREDAYDMQDVVNYLLNQISFYGYSGVPIHYMMIDEVQDLTPSTISLLLLLTKQKLFFSGDTAQTIAKGVGFRFCDLRSLFAESKLEMPTVAQLTMNFRTHRQILGLANSVVALLETMFPLTIDKMGSEVSPLEGPMPALVRSDRLEDLVHLMFGPMAQGDGGPQPEFGCNQVIIVRNQESKANLPSVLKHALCLTVYEAKGLEFDDVILYNFFTETEAEPALWAVLRTAKKKGWNDKYKPQNFEELEQGLPKLSMPMFFPNNASYSMLCTELKHLYVAITRPKKRLLIFDSDLDRRAPMEAYWRHMEVVDFIDVKVNEDGSMVTNAFSQGFAQRTSKTEWKKQGIKMFARKYYEQAEKCFALAGEELLEVRARGYTFANMAGEILTEIENKIQEAEWEKKTFTKADRKMHRMKRASAFSLFRRAAEAFLQVAKDGDSQDVERVKKEAARCFSSANEHARAAELFRDLGLYGQAAEAEIACGNCESAGDLFAMKDEYQRAIEAYKLGGCWDKLIKLINLFKHRMTIDERQKYIQKFMPAALEELTPKLIPQADADTQYIPLINKEIPATVIEMSEEESEEEEEEENVEEEKKEKENETEIKATEQVEINIEKNEEEADAEKNKTDSECQNNSSEIQSLLKIVPEEILPPSDLPSSVVENLSPAPSLPPNPCSLPLDPSSSFSLLSSDNSFALLSEGIDDINPDDEWLQLETGSVVESLGSLIQADGTIASDFSLLDDHRGAFPSGGRLIKTRGDIFIEDSTMRKIIEYISMFSEEVGTYLGSLRSANSLLSSRIFSQEWEMASLIDLDDISPQMLGLILDTLEEYGMYKLCLVVCNRYNMVDRAGRYIVSLAFKYSNIAMITYAAVKINPKEQIQRAAIAFTALHNVLEMINPCYLTVADNKALLGIETFQALVVLGYWKKVVFVVDTGNAKALAWSFGDFRVYKTLQVHGKQEELVDNKSVEDLIIDLDCYTELVLKSPSHTLPSDSDSFTDLQKSTFPYSFSVLSSLSGAASLIPSILSSFLPFHSYFKSPESKSSEIEVYDLCNFYAVLLLQIKRPFVTNSLLELSYSDFEKFLESCGYIVRFLRSGTCKYRVLPLLRHCLVAASGARSILPSSITSIYPLYSSSLVLHTSPLLPRIESDMLYAVDLESHCYLVANTEINRVFLEFIISNLMWIAETRKRYCESVSDHLNSLGELWKVEFISSEKQYSLKSFDYMAKVSPEVYANYVKLVQQKKSLGADEVEDVYYSEYLIETHKNEIKKLQRQIKSLQKIMSNAQPGERVRSMHQLVNLCKYHGEDSAVLTEISRQALLTHAQVLMSSSEVSVGDSKFTNSWMAYELCRIGGHHLCFVEMLRGRHRPVQVSYDLKQSKVSVFYSYVIALADITVYERHGCYSDITHTVLDLFELVECTDEIKLFLLQKATLCWRMSVSKKLVLPKSFEKFLSVRCDGVVRGQREDKYRLLEYCCKALTDFCVKAIPDGDKLSIVDEVSDCIVLILMESTAYDEKVLNIVKKARFQNGLSIAYGLVPYNCLFKIIEEMPKVSLVLQGSEVEVNHCEYPQEQLDKEWFTETRQIAMQQACANYLRRKIKKVPQASKISLLDLAYLTQNKKIYCRERAKILEMGYKYLKELFHTLYRIVLFKSLDMHYLIDQITLVANIIQNIDEGSNEENSTEILTGMNRLSSWRSMVQPKLRDSKEHAKKKWNVNWKKRVRDIKKKK